DCGPCAPVSGWCRAGRLHPPGGRDRMRDPTRGADLSAPMDPVASAFRLADSRTTPMHVGGLQLFSLPEGAGPEWVRAEYERSVALPEVAARYRKRPHRSLRT